MKKLIVRTDDLGYTEGVTYGILAAHRDGIVTTSSVMINMPFSKKAIELTREYPNLQLGLHINVTNGKCVSPIKDVPNLVDDNGYFLSSKYRRQLGKEGKQIIPVEEVYIEAVAQMKLFESIVGYKPEYIDIHALEISDFMEVAKRVREDYELDVCIYSDDTPVKMKDQALAHYSYYGKEDFGFLEYFKDEHFKFEDEVEVFICHPGFIDYELSKTSTFTDFRLLDYAMVTNKEVIKWIKDNNIELVNFKTAKK